MAENATIVVKRATSSESAQSFGAKAERQVSKEVVRAWEKQRVVARGKASKGIATHVANRDIRPGSAGKEVAREADTAKQEERAAQGHWKIIGPKYNR